MYTTLWFLIFTILVSNIVSPPVVPEEDKKKQVEDDMNKDDPLHKLEYSRYLKEVVTVLESDPQFKRMIENASVDDIKSGKIAENLDFVHHSVRTKLDELKRQEIERQTKLIARQMKLRNLRHDQIDSLMPRHLDHDNTDGFGSKDLEKLIRQASSDLEEIDRRRKDEFKQHELEKEYDRRKELEKLDEEHRKKAEEEHQREIEARKHHEKINHPGSKDQLEEVWEKEDKLEEDQFNPKTFFSLHDTDGDGLWSMTEVEALFQLELDKIYNTSDSKVDLHERNEEMNRMREHVLKEIDTNKDGVISLDEFIDSTKQKDFEKNEEWKSIEDEQQFDNKEFENYSRTHETEQEHLTTIKQDHH